jgi:hypothetical protein
MNQSYLLGDYFDEFLKEFMSVNRSILIAKNSIFY